MKNGMCERPNINIVVLDGQSAKWDKIISPTMKNKLKKTHLL